MSDYLAWFGIRLGLSGLAEFLRNTFLTIHSPITMSYHRMKMSLLEVVQPRCFHTPAL